MSFTSITSTSNEYHNLKSFKEFDDLGDFQVRRSAKAVPEWLHTQLKDFFFFLIWESVHFVCAGGLTLNVMETI